MKLFEKMVSIIVPVYNAEQYLATCIDSLMNQSYKNIEVILINDGSTDNSGKICDEYAKKDSRIKVIHQKNSGPSVARNTGINASVGNYIQFVDSDDSIEPNMSKKLIEAMNEDVQLVICGYNTINMNGDNVSIQKDIPTIDGVHQNTEFIKNFGEFYKNNFINPLWNKLYVTNIIKKFNIFFAENLNLGEDLLFNLEYIKFCNNINIIKCQLYNYLIFNNNSSLTESFKNKLFENQQMLFLKVREFLLEKGSFTGENENSVEITYTNRIVGCFENIFHKDSNLNSKQRKKEIFNILDDDCLRNKNEYFKNSSVQKRFIGFLIKYKLVSSIYWFFKIKKILRNKMYPLFNLLKTVNSIQRGKI